MSVNNVDNKYNNYSTYLAEKNKPVNSQNKAEEAEKKNTDENKNTSVDGDKYEAGKTTEYKTNWKTFNTMKSTMQQKVASFEKLVSSMFHKQGVAYNKSLGVRDNLQALIDSGGVSAADRLEAQAAVAEDGEWGVDKTAGRILDFAKAMSGGDPSKIGLLKDAVMKGFKEAESMWVGKLPDISQKTLDKVMDGFDEWEKSQSKTEPAEQPAQ